MLRRDFNIGLALAPSVGREVARRVAAASSPQAR
jgi:hypothetical protein